MNIEKERNYLTLFTIVLGVLVFVMLYVWQSIEVMKIKLEYRALLRKQESLVLWSTMPSSTLPTSPAPKRWPMPWISGDFTGIWTESRPSTVR